MAEGLDADTWSPLSAGEGAKGPREYEWARLSIGSSKNNGMARWMLFRRSLRDPKALAYDFFHAPEDTWLAEIAGAAGLRWTIEECFLRVKDDPSLDHCEAGSWHGWHRHMTLFMAAAAFPAKLAADQRRHAFGKPIKAIREAKAA